MNYLTYEQAVEAGYYIMHIFVCLFVCFFNVFIEKMCTRYGIICMRQRFRSMSKLV